MATHPFFAHLATIIPLYEQGTDALIPDYDGPTDPQIDAILGSLDAMAKRMYVAEMQNNPPSQSDANVPPPPASTNSKSAENELQDLKRQIADASTCFNAIARGDFSYRMTIEPHDPVMAQLKEVMNETADRLAQFSRELTRVGREVGTEGKLGVQALVTGLQGEWLDVTHAVNQMAASITSQVRSVARVTRAVALGDLTRRIEKPEARGEMLELDNIVNAMVHRLAVMGAELTRLALEVGMKGRLGGQAFVPDAEGLWLELTRCVNWLCATLTDQTRSVASVSTAVARGDLTQKMDLMVEGELLATQHTVNAMVDQLSIVATEVSQTASDMGTESLWGRQARIEGPRGAWVDMASNVNTMAANFTNLIRCIAEVTKATATGDLSMRVAVEARGEMLDLKMTVNAMQDRLSHFASEVSRVAREVVTEGVLDSQAVVPDAEGTWKRLTDDVNAMARSLTALVRAFAQASAAAMDGDFSRVVPIETNGETERFGVHMNQMILNLRDSVRANTAARIAAEAARDELERRRP